MFNSVPSFFRSKKPRQFGYAPVYFDEDKARVEERRDIIETEMGLRDPGNGEERLKRLRTQVKGRWEGNPVVASAAAQKERRIRLVVIFGVLLALVYFTLELVFRIPS